MLNLEYSHIALEKAKYTGQIVVKGEIANRSAKNYTAVATRIIIFIKGYPAANTVLVINNLSAGATKIFEKYVEGIHYDDVFKDIKRIEVFAEEAY
jgi:S-adenosylmethionine synthetase